VTTVLLCPPTTLPSCEWVSVRSLFVFVFFISAP
jgi:hypothetical protein